MMFRSWSGPTMCSAIAFLLVCGACSAYSDDCAAPKGLADAARMISLWLRRFRRTRPRVRRIKAGRVQPNPTHTAVAGCRQGLARVPLKIQG